jgi:Zn-dependent protease
MMAGPPLFVFTKLNILLMVVALLPLGPFDGHRAWAVIPWLRRSIRRRRQIRQSSTKAAAELMDKLSKKASDRKEDA